MLNIVIFHLNDAELFILGLLSKFRENFQKNDKSFEDEFYDSSQDQDCFGYYEESNDESEESPSKYSRLEKYGWVSLDKFFDTVGSLSQKYRSLFQLENKRRY